MIAIFLGTAGNPERKRDEIANSLSRYGRNCERGPSLEQLWAAISQIRSSNRRKTQEAPRGEICAWLKLKWAFAFRHVHDALLNPPSIGAENDRRRAGR